MSKTIHRIIQLINQLNISARQFDLSIGTANGYILRMNKNSASVGSDVIERIKEVYPQVNLVWLITGEGEMLLKNDPKPKRSMAEIEQYIDNQLEKKLNIEKQRLIDEIIEEIESEKLRQGLE